MFSEKKIFYIYLIISIGANDSWGVANLDPRGMVGRIYIGDHYSLLHTNVSFGPHVFREDFLGFFSYIVLYKQMIPLGMASLGPKDLIGRIYVGDH